MSYFKGLIQCLNCGKNYNFKNDHNLHVYICSGTKNYGSEFYPRRIIKEEDLLYLVENHCRIYNLKFDVNKIRTGELVEKITVDTNGEIKIYYIDGKLSLWNSTNIIY